MDARCIIFFTLYIINNLKTLWCIGEPYKNYEINFTL